MLEKKHAQTSRFDFINERTREKSHAKSRPADRESFWGVKTYRIMPESLSQCWKNVFVTTWANNEFCVTVFVFPSRQENSIAIKSYREKSFKGIKYFCESEPMRKNWVNGSIFFSITLQIVQQKTKKGWGHLLTFWLMAPLERWFSFPPLCSPENRMETDPGASRPCLFTADIELLRIALPICPSEEHIVRFHVKSHFWPRLVAKPKRDWGFWKSAFPVTQHTYATLPIEKEKEKDPFVFRKLFPLSSRISLCPPIMLIIGQKTFCFTFCGLALLSLFRLPAIKKAFSFMQSLPRRVRL